MKRSHALALSSAALLLALSTSSYAQVTRPGQQCVPAVADASLYRDCRLHIVHGREVCRCAVAPQVLDRLNRDVTATGSLRRGIRDSDQTFNDGQTGRNGSRRGGDVANNSGGGTSGGQAGGGTTGGGSSGGNKGGAGGSAGGNTGSGGNSGGSTGGGNAGGNTGGTVGGGGTIGGGGST